MARRAPATRGVAVVLCGLASALAGCAHFATPEPTPVEIQADRCSMVLAVLHAKVPGEACPDGRPCGPLELLALRCHAIPAPAGALLWYSHYPRYEDLELVDPGSPEARYATFVDPSAEHPSFVDPSFACGDHWFRLVDRAAVDPELEGVHLTLHEESAGYGWEAVLGTLRVGTDGGSKCGSWTGHVRRTEDGWEATVDVGPGIAEPRE